MYRAAEGAATPVPALRRQYAAMEIVLYPDPVLRRGGAEVTVFDADLRELADAMFEAMYRYDGVGLAAPQVGVEQKLLVLNPQGTIEDRSQELALVNPRIVAKKGREWGQEGCLSFPGIYADVERHQRITVVYQDLEGAEQELRVDDFLGRIVQHELDHLQGVLFIDRFTPAEKIRVRARLQELEDRYRARA